MRSLSLKIVLVLALVLMSARVIGDSPHGKDFKLSCDLCHSSSSWKLDKSIYAFDHSTTTFPLAGQHQVADCRQCHVSLVFNEAKNSCVDCHTDMHQQTVGPDCGRCHTPKSWIVENITEIHQRSRFPLVGAHYTADCNQCHPSAS
ncbi:MAG: cytochrome c3 family protein, partial [bacterium]